MPLLSLIIPTYNRSALLAEALESLQLQEFTDYEVIVVDDGSTDDTPITLARYLEPGSPIKLRVLRQANAGQGAARNLGIAQARGEYCAFLDSDDLFFPWTLAIVAEAITGNGRPPVILGKELRFKTPDEFHAANRAPLKTTRWPDLYSYAILNHLGASGTIVARTGLLKEVGGFLTERIVGEDADLMLRLGVTPNMVKIEEPALYGYRVHPENFTASQDRWYDGACELIRRYRSGAFPGAPTRSAEARKLVANDAAYFSLVCLYFGGRRNCLSLYLKIVRWQLLAGNFGYALKTPLRLVLSLMGRWPIRRPGVPIGAELLRP